MAPSFLEAISTRDGKTLFVTSSEEGSHLLELINHTRPTRLLFDTLLTDTNVLKLITAHQRVLSPVEVAADELNLSGEMRGPFVRFFPIPILFGLHGEQPLSEDDVMMAAASASVDARISWDSIEKRMRPWLQNHAASVPRPNPEVADAKKADASLAPTKPDDFSTGVRNALSGIDPNEALDRIIRAASSIAGGEGLPLLKSLPLLPMGIIAKVGVSHRDRVIKECGLSQQGYDKALENLAFAHVLQIGFSMFCCPRHRDYPLAFVAVGQTSAPYAKCPVCGVGLPGLSSYHFEPVSSALLGRTGGILEPLVWRVLEAARIPYAPLARLTQSPENEFDAIFSSKEGGYGVVECKVWQHRLDDDNAREPVRQALAQLNGNVSMLVGKGVEVEHAVLVSNRFQENQRQIVKSVIEERRFKALAGVETTHLSPDEIPQLKQMGPTPTAAPSSD